MNSFLVFFSQVRLRKQAKKVLCGCMNPDVKKQGLRRGNESILGEIELYRIIKPSALCDCILHDSNQVQVFQRTKMPCSKPDDDFTNLCW